MLEPAAFQPWPRCQYFFSGFWKTLTQVSVTFSIICHLRLLHLRFGLLIRPLPSSGSVGSARKHITSQFCHKQGLSVSVFCFLPLPLRHPLKCGMLLRHPLSSPAVFYLHLLHCSLASLIAICCVPSPHPLWSATG